MTCTVAGSTTGQPLPGYLRREPLLNLTAGIVARRDHPFHTARPTPEDLVHSPWLDCYSSAPTVAKESGPSLAGILEQLRERTGKRAGPVLRAGATGFLLLAKGPWLSWLPLAFLARLPWLGIAPLALNFGRRRYRTGLVVRRSAEDLKPVRLFEEIVREIVLEGPR